MKQIIYAMQFKGQGGPGGSPNVLKAMTSSPSCTITTVIGSEGVHGSVQPAPGGKAAFESEVTVTGETSFLESGSIRFGDGNHRLRFSTVGQGYLADSPEPKLKSGAVMWKVEGGEGQFAGASGYITSNFTMDEAGHVTDNFRATEDDVDAATPMDAQNAPTGVWKSRSEREIPTVPTSIIFILKEEEQKRRTKSKSAQTNCPPNRIRFSNRTLLTTPYFGSIPS